MPIKPTEEKEIAIQRNEVHNPSKNTRKRKRSNQEVQEFNDYAPMTTKTMKHNTVGKPIVLGTVH